MVARRLGTVVVSTICMGLLLGSASITWAQQQSSNQRRCLVGINRDAQKVSARQGKEIENCLRDQARGKDPNGLIEDCIVADERGRVSDARGRVVRTEERHCSTPPDFGFTSAFNANGAAISKELNLVHDVFGSDLDAVTLYQFATNRNEARCQQSSGRNSRRCQNAHQRVYDKCKSIGLKDGSITSAAGLEACMDTDPGGRVSRACDGTTGRIRVDLDRRCLKNGVDLSDVHAGICADDDPDVLAACIESRVRCRVCKYWNRIDALTRDCDDYDDGIANASCF